MQRPINKIPITLIGILAPSPSRNDSTDRTLRSIRDESQAGFNLLRIRRREFYDCIGKTERSAPRGNTIIMLLGLISTSFSVFIYIYPFYDLAYRPKLIIQMLFTLFQRRYFKGYFTYRFVSILIIC